MEQVVRRISLDLSRRANKRYFYGNKTEFNSRVFIISFCDDGVPYFVDQKANAIVNVLRSDGRSWSYLSKITEDGCVYFAATLWCFEAPGETKFTVTLYNSKMRITSSPFYIDVADDLAGTEHNDEVAENATLFQQAMENFALTNENEVERQENENERIEAEINRDNGELYRMEEERKRDDAESIRLQNESKRCEVTETMIRTLDNLLTLQQIYIDKGEEAV